MSMRISSVMVIGVLLLSATALLAADNPRIYVTDSQSWEVRAGGGGVDGTFGQAGSGGARPQTAEIVKTFNERCPNVIVNNRREKADYIVLLDHEGGKASVSRDNKVAIFHNASGDAIFSRSTRSLGNSVKDACSAIYRDFSRRSAAEARSREVEASLSSTQADAVLQTVAGSAAGARVHVQSSVSGADVEIDGKFVGSTPSTLVLSPGTHSIVVSKAGFAPWKRTLDVTSGEVSLIAELSKR